MTTLRGISLKVVRWTGWLLIPVVLAFFATGYAISGRYGLGELASEEEALALHRMLHVPLATLVLVHVLPSVYLAMVRWGWIRTDREKE